MEALDGIALPRRWIPKANREEAHRQALEQAARVGRTFTSAKTSPASPPASAFPISASIFPSLEPRVLKQLRL